MIPVDDSMTPRPAGESRTPDILHVLVVEDSPADAELIRGLIALAKSLRCVPEHVTTLEEALKRLKKDGVDAVLLDLNLPDSAGLETAQKILAAAPDVPTIVLSGLDEREIALRAVHQGAQDYLIKSDVGSHLLERALRYAVERQRLLDEIQSKYHNEIELSRFKTQLVSMVSHDFANALSVIECGLPLIEESMTATGDRGRKVLYQHLKSGVRALHLTAHNLLNLGRMESGKLKLRFGEVEAGELARDSLKSLDALCRDKRLRVTLKLPARPLWIRADEESLSLVMANLLSNAIKYTPTQGKIAVGAARDPESADHVLFFVEDNGIGISLRDQKRIFAPYFRTTLGQKTAQGFGVGLTFARTILEAHGSSLKVKSSPGRGSRFSFKLPLGTGSSAPERF